MPMQKEAEETTGRRAMAEADAKDAREALQVVNTKVGVFLCVRARMRACVVADDEARVPSIDVHGLGV